MPDGVGLCDFRSQCAQPEVGSRGATHKEKEVSSLGIIHPRDALEENLLLCGFVLQEMLHESFMADGNPQNLQALLDWRQQGVTAPRAWLHRSSSSGQNLHATQLRATSIPHLRLPMVQMDSSMGPQLLLHGNMCPIHSRKARRGVNVVQIREHVLASTQPRLCGFQRSMLSEGEQHGHEGIAFPQTCGWAAVETSHDLLPPSVTGPEASRCGRSDRTPRPSRST